MIHTLIHAKNEQLMQTWKLTKTLVKVGQNQLFLENKMAIKFDFRHGAKKSGRLDHSLQIYGKIFFHIFYEKLVGFGCPSALSKTRIFSFMI